MKVVPRNFRIFAGSTLFDLGMLAGRRFFRDEHRLQVHEFMQAEWPQFPSMP